MGIRPMASAEELLRETLVETAYEHAKHVLAFGAPREALELLDLLVDRYPECKAARSNLQDIEVKLRSTEFREIFKYIESDSKTNCNKYKINLDNIWASIHRITNLFDGNSEISLHNSIDQLIRLSEVVAKGHDGAWPVVEAWEQIARWIRGDDWLSEVFVTRYLAFLRTTSNEYLHCACIWGINEFLERKGERNLGYRLFDRLHESEIIDQSSLRIIEIVKRLHKDLNGRANNDNAAAIFSDNQFRACEGDYVSVRKTISELEEIDSLREADWSRIFDPITKYWDGALSKGGMGIVAMGFMRLLMEELMETHFDPNNDASTTTIEHMSRMCEPLFSLANSTENDNAFLVIESLEPVRDERGAETGIIFGRYLKNVVNHDLAYGIGVCMCEGYEENEKHGARKRFFFDEHGETPMWFVIDEIDEWEFQDLDEFFDEAKVSFSVRDDLLHVAEWINARLDIHSTLLPQAPSEPEDHSGPVLRTFLNIAQLWRLSNDEQMQLLGATDRNELVAWKKDSNVTLRRDTLERISYVLGIYRSLQVLLPDQVAADEWVRRANDASIFGGNSALDRMLSGNVSDLYVVRQYLDAQWDS